MDSLDLASLSVHADDELALVRDVASPLHVSTTYHYSSDPDTLQCAKDHDIRISKPGEQIYSRFGNPVVERVEAVLSQLFGAHAIVYSSGLSAFTAAITHLQPRRMALGDDGYHGCHGVVAILSRFGGEKHGIQKVPLYDDSIAAGDLVHIETPLNPTGVAIDLEKASSFAHSRGAKLLVDATFAPPPIQDPFACGADLVMHSATKYFGGHSDLLAGILVTKDPDVSEKLRKDRSILGLQPGNMEAWLLLRSLRTYKLRITQQATSAAIIVAYLADQLAKGTIPALAKVHHSSLQDEPFVARQMPAGLHSPTFSIELTSMQLAKRLPSKLKLFHHATSLGGVESLIEWRAMTDEHVSESLLRISVGVEAAEDLIADLQQGLLSLE
ncbi:Cys/Met metabolism PLP-dependent enzyme-domain-containing protein [Kockiozyma suomiensis]|uniref:Cys/Met metabolism PLP-dependent enzyme-domain-containing protein n=1 Tax=Kockiozyma suomiensis TaxID=1337062 RepID=UPI0033432229